MKTHMITTQQVDLELPNGKEVSILVRFNENNHPVFSIPEEIMKMFDEKLAQEKEDVD